MGLLCKVAPENLEHFLLDCPKLRPVRVGYFVSEIEQSLLQVASDDAAHLLTDTELLCRTIMDCTVLGDSISGELLDGFGAKMEALSRNLREPHYWMNVAKIFFFFFFFFFYVKSW